MYSEVLKKLTVVDQVARPDHHYLVEGDQCMFFGEYTPRKGYKHSPANQLVFNLKIKPEHRATPRWRHKTTAMMYVGRALATILRENTRRNMTFVPIPPSKVKGDDGYDSRNTDILCEMAAASTFPVDIRELVEQHESTRPSHESDARLSRDELEALYRVPEALAAQKVPSSLVLFDDLLTTGAHFCAARTVLLQRFPGVPVYGVFACRRKPESPFDVVDVDALMKEMGFD